MGLTVESEREQDFFGMGGTCHSSVPPNLRAGMRIGDKYELLRKVGNGAMGEVWAARHTSLGEEVAIKLVLREIVHEDGSTTDSRFLLEARVSAQLSRKTRHIVSVTDHGEHGPYAYLVMDLLKGESLDTRLGRSGPMPVSKVVPLIYQVARALAVAHADGVVHRDLKPSNIFVTADEDERALIKILDFGIAKMRPISLRRLPISAPVTLRDTRDPVATLKLNSKNKHTTLSGFLLGTPEYMSPEQARGKPIDHRADVWALAVIAYHLLTEQFPFGGETIEDLFERLHCVDTTPIAAYRPELSPRVGELFVRAFSPRIEQRFQSAVAFARALEQVETMHGRSDGGTPAAMVKISLPPSPLVILGGADDEPVFVTPSPLPLIPRPGRMPTLPTLAAPKHETGAALKHTGSLVAAGVPRKKTTQQRLFVAFAAALALFGATAGALSVYRDGDTGNSRALSSGAKATSPITHARDEIPTPDSLEIGATTTSTRPIAQRNAITRPQDLPASPSSPPPTSLRPQTASLQGNPPPPTTPVNAQSMPTTSMPAPSKRMDRSEVF